MEDESDDDLDAHIDAICAALRASPAIVKHPSLEALGEHFEDDRDWSEPFSGLDPVLEESFCDAHLLENWDPWDGENDDEEPPLTDDMRLEYMRMYVKGVLEEGGGDADVNPMFDSIPLEATDGSTGILGYGVSGYSFSGVETEWHGVFATRQAFADWLRSEGWILTMEDFDKLDRAAKLAFWDT